MSWGNKLLITFLVFGSGIIYLVFRCMQTDFELVEKDYYKTELGYQQVIDATHHTQALSAPVAVVSTPAGVQIQLPAEMKNKAVQGDIWFYCAYNSSRDRKVRLSPDRDARQLLPDTLLSPGTYTAKISWVDESAVRYYAENNITVK